MKKILITGASGFIGSFLTDEALKRNYEVYAGVRKSSCRDYLTDPAIRFFEMDFSQKENLKKQLETAPRFDYIIHAAGVVKSCNKKDFVNINYQYTKIFIEALRETGKIPEKFIFISSLAIFGPGNETTLQPIKPTDKPHPVTQYGKSKLMAEQFIISLTNFPYIILRPTGVYGPREKDYYLAYKSVKKGIESYIGAKEQHLTFVYVTDLTRLVFDTLTSIIINKAYFVTDLKQYTVQQFNAIIKKTLNKKAVTIVFPKMLVKTVALINEKLSCLFGKPSTLNSDKYNELICKNWLCESDEIVNDFSFQPEYDLEKGLHKTIAWLKKEKLL
jgi:nucleoside-diphosphate-sugar epimerase